jgi:pimeloyl-ACP methyl ester carboxylesterase
MSLARCSPLTSRLLLFPSNDERSLDGAERVMIADPHGAIETIRAKSPAASATPARAIVLRFYGNADRADAWVHGEALSFGDWPVEVWGVNYPGFGLSEGSASLAGVARAADVAFVEAEKRGLPIFAMGTSMGTAAALHLGTKGNLRGMFLHNPPPLPELIRGRYGWWNLWLLAGPISWSVPSSLDSLANARVTTAPALVVSSAEDELVPFAYQTKVFDACAGAKERIVVAGAQHNDPIPPAAWNDIHAALRRMGWQ